MTRRIPVKVCCSPALAQFWPSVRHPAVKARNSFLRASRRSIWGHDPGENFDQPARDWSDPATFPSGVSRRATLEAAEQQLIVVKQLRLSSVVWRKIEAAALATGQGAPGTFQTALALLWPGLPSFSRHPTLKLITAPGRADWILLLVTTFLSGRS